MIRHTPKSLGRPCEGPQPEAAGLLTDVKNLRRNTYDSVLDDDLLRLDPAAAELALPQARELAERLWRAGSG